MADADIARIFQSLSDELRKVSSVVGTQTIVQAVPSFDGDSKKFKFWVKSIEKYGMVTGADDAKLKMVAFQSSKNNVSDFIQRYLNEHPDCTWAHLKDELKVRFAEIQDQQYALSLLRTLKQAVGENVQNYAERLLSLAEDAYRHNAADMPVIEQQLIGYFTDGLAHGYLRLKVMSQNPTSLQAAVKVAVDEQNLRARFNLRSGLEPVIQHPIDPGHTPMEVDHLRPSKSCTYCKKLGHLARDCRKRIREINAYSAEYASQEHRINHLNRKARMECWNCGKLGHFRRECTRNFYNRQYNNRRSEN